MKVATKARKPIALEGQEKEVTTAGIARMKMILQDFPTTNILSGARALTQVRLQELLTVKARLV